MRGNLTASGRQTNLIRSIPAHAGEPRPAIHGPKCTRVYPRACGGTQRLLAGLVPLLGLSPRMRGNRRDPQGRGPGHGSIPAHAGEPQPPARSVPAATVYPAHAGEPACRPVPILLLGVAGGLSPRMRGNRTTRKGQSSNGGSIPAHAGEPGYVGPMDHVNWVYPRACGGTQSVHR